MTAPERIFPTLPPMTRAVAESWLTEPWLPATALAQLPAITRAAAARVPVVLRVTDGIGRRRLARAVAALAGDERPLQLWDGAGVPPAGGSVLLEATSDAAWPTASCVADDGGVWLLLAVDPAAPAIDLGVETLTIEVPPLASRPAIVPVLAAQHLGRLAARGERPAPRLDDAVTAGLVAAPWPGDVGELETLLTRAFLTGGDLLTAETLTITPAPPTAALPTPVPAAAPADGRLELLLAEMAHEIRNPLVTIKTFASHLPALLEDAALRERFVQLTDEGIARMEGALDNVLEYGRLQAPRPQTVDVPPLVDRLLADVGPGFEERGIAVERTGVAHATCAADPEHLEFALRNLLAGVAREMPAGEPLALDASANGVVRLRFAPGGTTATRLRALATSGPGEALYDPDLLPLPFSLARAALERCGGMLGVTPDDGGTTTLVVRLPLAAA